MTKQAAAVESLLKIIGVDESEITDSRRKLSDMSLSSRARLYTTERKVADKTAFDKLVEELRAKGVKDPEALAASIGRKKYGKEAFQAKAAAGRKKDDSE